MLILAAFVMEHSEIILGVDFDPDMRYEQRCINTFENRQTYIDMGYPIDDAL